MRKVILLILFLFSLVAEAQQRDPVLRNGKHYISFQWVSRKYFGTAIITKTGEPGTYKIIGSHYSKTNNDYLKIEGTLKPLTEKHLVFEGFIDTKINYINNGINCHREGKFNFNVSGERQYWRLQEMSDPCDSVTDYIDIYFMGP